MVQALVETHSETFVLALQHLVERGELKPEDVSLNWISSRNGVSRIERIHLDEDGDFETAWPEGFFDERFAARDSGGKAEAGE